MKVRVIAAYRKRSGDLVLPSDRVIEMKPKAAERLARAGCVEVIRDEIRKEVVLIPDHDSGTMTPVRARRSRGRRRK